MAATTSHTRTDGETGPARLGRYIRELYLDPRLVPFLHRLSLISCQILGGIGGSISVVEETGRRYLKVAEYGTECKIGHSFPLNEGVTGLVFAERRPVVLDSYRDIERGHMPPGSPVGDAAVAAVPMWWRGQLIGANVVFAERPRRFALEDLGQLETVTAAAVPGVVTASADDPSLAHLLFSGGLAEDRRAGSRRSLPHVLMPVPTGDGGDGDLDGADGDGLRLLQDGECPLSSREFEVLTMVARGLSTRAIAEAMDISPKTVEKHIGNVLRKTNSENRTGAVALAFAAGWVV